jgi:hypothetical protein
VTERPLGATDAVLLGLHGEVHRHNGRGHTLCEQPVRAGAAVAVNPSQIMVYELALCARCYQRGHR